MYTILKIYVYYTILYVYYTILFMRVKNKKTI